MRSTLYIAPLMLVALVGCSRSMSPSEPPPPPPGTYTVVGDSAAVAAKLDEFRAALGGSLNAPGTTSQPSGRREIDWDDVPAVLTNVDNFPYLWFNANSKRGAVFHTPGRSFRVDSTAFTSVSAGLAGAFKPFSTKNMFMPVQSRFLDVHFFQVGCTCTAADLARVSGFGVVLSDVDRAGSSRVEFFDRNDVLLATVIAPARPGSGQYSFVGAVFPSAVVFRVRITAGDGALGDGSTDVSAGGALDLVVIDDLVYAEPQVVSN